MLSKNIFTFIKKRKKLFIILGVILLAGVMLWNFFSPKKSAQQYQTATVTKGTLIVSAGESGQVSVANRTAITTSATGVVTNVYVKEGDEVSAGEKIADIALDKNGQQQADQAYASYLSAQNSLTNAQTQLNTLQSTLFQTNQAFLNDTGIANPTDQDKANPKYIEENDAWLAAQANYINQQNVIAQAQASLNSAAISYQNSSASIIAPTSGTLTDLTITQGMQITAVSSSNNSSSIANTSTTVANIRTQGNPVISVELSEIDVTKVKSGDSATITLDALPDKTFTGKVVGINTTGTVSSGVTNYPATILLDTPSNDILPNMSATANIITDIKNNVLLVPNAAVLTSGGVSTVRVLKNGQVSSIEVTIGESSDTQTEITSGLSEGDTVVTSAAVTGTSTTSSGGTSPFSRSIFGGGGFGGGTAVRVGAGGGGAARGAAGGR